MRTFVITGAAGFIGGHLARNLMSRSFDTDRVVALVRDGDAPVFVGSISGSIEVVRGELEDLRACERLIAEHQPDGVFHLAAQAKVEIGKRDPFNTMESNVRGTYNLLESFRRHRKAGSKLIMASSDKAYGELPEGSSGYTEDMLLEGRGPYDASKSCADLIAQSYGMEYGLPIAIIRAGNVYGRGDRDLSRIVPSLIADVANYRPLTVRSDGTPIRDYIHVDDVAYGYVQAFEKHSVETARAYNLANRTPLSVKEMAEEVLRTVRDLSYEKLEVYRESVSKCKAWLNRTDGKIEILGTRRGEISHQELDPSRAEKELQWSPQTLLKDGLRETLLWGLYNLVNR